MNIFYKYIPLLSFESSLALQHSLVQSVQQKTLGNIILLTQHPPTFTAGRRLKNSLVDEKRFRSLGADYFQINRGGQMTFHGPGQLVVYPILDLKSLKVALA
jgi:lipoate-protein ligase B